MARKTKVESMGRITRSVRMRILVLACAASSACDAPLDTPRIHGETLFPRKATPARPDEGTASPAPIARRSVPLVAGLVGELPESFSDWRVAHAPGQALLVHAEGGSSPDAWAYFSEMDSVARTVPSLAFARFLLTVDPNLADLDAVAGAFQRVVVRTASPVMQADKLTQDPAMRELLDLPWLTLLTPTMGGGLGYVSTPGSFSGWHWSGETASGLLIRAAKTRGQATGGAWEGAARLTRVEQTLRALVTQQGADAAHGLVALLNELGRVFTPRAAATPTTPPTGAATMTLGSVETSPGAGAFFAVVCTGRETCDAGSDLARLIDSLSSARGQGVGSPGNPAFAELAARVGIRFVSLAELEGLSSVWNEAFQAPSSGPSGGDLAPEITQPESPEPGEKPGTGSIPD